MFPRSLPFMLLMSHASKLLLHTIFKTQLQLKKAFNLLSDWSKSLGLEKDRDLKLLTIQRMHIFVTRLAQQAITHHIYKYNRHHILCMVRCLCNQLQTRLHWCAQELMMWQCDKQRYFFLFLQVSFSLLFEWYFIKYSFSKYN